jgi:putative transposase
VKYEEVYLKQHGSLQDLLMGLTRCFMFYNDERLHQALDYKTPDVVYRTAAGGAPR